MQARAIIGPHGGALFSMMYAPPRTLVVEFVPSARWRVVFWVRKRGGNYLGTVPLSHNSTGKYDTRCTGT